MGSSVSAVGFSSGTRSPERKREFVRGYVIAFLLLVERLRRLQRAARREAEAAVRVALERREVVEERRALGRCSLRSTDSTVPVLPATLATISSRRARPPRCRLLAGRGPCRRPPGRTKALVARVEGRVNEPVRLGDEGLDLALAADDDRQRRRLHPAERDDAADPARGRGSSRRASRSCRRASRPRSGRARPARAARAARRGAGARSPRGSPASSSS